MPPCGPTNPANDAFPSPSDQVVVVVDPYSTGCLVAQEIAKHGYSLVALWTAGFSPDMKTHVPSNCGPMNWMAEVEQGATMEETAARVHAAADSKGLAACIAGGEAGVDLADGLSEFLGLRTNGTEIPNRRDKKVQQELIRKTGLRSVRQSAGSKFEEVEDFLKSETFPLVLKPTESAGSDGVKLCQSFDEAKEHFEVLMKSQMVNGGNCPAVLCQEFLRGKEYVVDHVSRDGKHVTTMCWVYDKRPANGSAFVYFGCVPVDSNSPEAKILIPYTRAVLDAMGVKNGPSHGEVMMTKDGPCLIEMNCRAHGGDGAWRPLCRALTGGYSQVEATVDAFLDEAHFLRLPDKPPSPFKASGQEVILVSFSRGKVKSTPGYEVMKHLPSFVLLETGIKNGSEVDYTIDLFTGIGSVILMHQDEEILNRDIEFVRYMEQINGLFVYETETENLKRPPGDAVVLDTISENVAGEEVNKNHHRRVFSSDGPMLIRHMSNDRPELMGPLMKHMSTVDSSKELVVLIDPYSTGCGIAEEILKRCFRVVALWTRGFSADMKTRVALSVGKIEYHAEVDEAETLADAAGVYMAAGTLRVAACGAEVKLVLTWPMRCRND